MKTVKIFSVMMAFTVTLFASQCIAFAGNTNAGGRAGIGFIGPNTVYVVFHDNWPSGVGGSGTTHHPIQVNVGNSLRADGIDIPQHTSPQGYLHDGWFFDIIGINDGVSFTGTPFNRDVVINRNINVYARWRRAAQPTPPPVIPSPVPQPSPNGETPASPRPSPSPPILQESPPPPVTTPSPLPLPTDDDNIYVGGGGNNGGTPGRNNNNDDNILIPQEIPAEVDEPADNAAQSRPAARSPVQAAIPMVETYYEDEYEEYFYEDYDITELQDNIIAAVHYPDDGYMEDEIDLSAMEAVYEYDADQELVDITPGRIPLTAPNGVGAWALLNLILSILGIILTVAAWIYAISRKRKNIDEPEPEAGFVSEEEAEAALLTEPTEPDISDLTVSSAEEEQKRVKSRNRYLSLGIAAVLSVLAAVLFILTQDITNMIVWADRYTILHAIMFVTEAILIFISYRRDKTKDDENKIIGEDHFETELGNELQA